jgi:hypothetical protein
MMFRPKYCCNCGEKVEREEWRIWTSRRFCDLCSTEYKHIDLFPYGAVGLGLLLSVLGISGILGGSSEPDLARNPNTTSSSTSSSATLKSHQAANTARQDTVTTPTISEPRQPTPQNTEQPRKKENSSEDEVFYCGAPTKKGTPCTRRVKTKGNCWQHAKQGQINPTRF